MNPLERFMRDCLNACLVMAITVISIVMLPITVPLGMLYFWLATTVWDWVGRCAAFFGISKDDVDARMGAAKSALGEWSRDPFRLQTYGDSMRTLQVKRDQETSTKVLTAAFFFCLIAWWLLFSYSGFNLLFRVVLTLGFAVMEIMLDRLINVQYDEGGWKRWRTIISRGVILLILASLNSVPLELAVFAPEIDDVIHDREVAKVDVIRAKALEGAEAIVAKESAAKTATLTGSTKDADARRVEERARIEARRPEILARLSAKSDELAAEVGNGVRTGKTGYGPAAKALKVEVDAIRKEGSDLDDRLAAFDAETAVLHVGSVDVTVKQQAVDAVALDRERARITALSPEALIAEFGGEYKEPDGFLARYGILLEIVDAPEAGGNGGWTRNKVIYYGCKLLMTAFGLVLIIIKFGMMSPFTVAYYDPHMQAINGDPDSRRLIRLLARRGDAKAKETLLQMAEEDAERAAAAIAAVAPTP